MKLIIIIYFSWYYLELLILLIFKHSVSDFADEFESRLWAQSKSAKFPGVTARLSVSGHPLFTYFFPQSRFNWNLLSLLFILVGIIFNCSSWWFLSILFLILPMNSSPGYELSQSPQNFPALVRIWASPDTPFFRTFLSPKFVKNHGYSRSKLIKFLVLRSKSASYLNSRTTAARKALVHRPKWNSMRFNLPSTAQLHRKVGTHPIIRSWSWSTT